MKLLTIIPTSAAIGLVLTAGLALAQGMNEQPSSQGDQKTQQGGGMGGMDQQKGGGMNMDGGKQGGCGMMNSMATLQERVNQLEQRLNSGQAQPSTPAKPQ